MTHFKTFLTATLTFIAVVVIATQIGGAPAVAQHVANALPAIPFLSDPVGDPVRLTIPSIKVDAAVEYVGLNDENEMDVPKAWENVAWYQLGPKPGEDGNAVIAGHLDSQTAEAVFWDLKKMKAGDLVEVLDDRGKTWTFEVESVEKFTDETAPADRVFGDASEPRLNLVTCAGSWRGGEYTERLIVFTKLKE